MEERAGAWVGVGDIMGDGAREEVGVDCAGIGIFWQSPDPMIFRALVTPGFDDILKSHPDSIYHKRLQSVSISSSPLIRGAPRVSWIQKTPLGALQTVQQHF